MTSIANGAADGGWQNLKRMRTDRDYTVLMRNGSCITGRVAAVDTGALELFEPRESANQKTTKTDVRIIEANRNDVLRVTDTRFGDPHDTIYSGRSSWTDVKASRPKGKAEWLKVVDKRGKERTCKTPEASDDGLRCGTEEISKKDIARVYYVRLKPASDWLEYASGEGVGGLDPRTWFNYMLLGRIDVLLFDSALPEDNQAAACRVDGH